MLRIAAFGVALCSLSAHAAIVVVPAVQLSAGLASDPKRFELNFAEVGDGVFATEAKKFESAEFDFTWGVTVKPDPFISGGFTFVNNTLATQTFIVSVTLPIIAVTPSSLIGGSVGLTLTDSNFNGVATVSDAGTGIYMAQIDGVDVLELMDDPYSLSVVFAGQTVIDNDIDGLPGPTISGPAALSTISIVHKFHLTAGDSLGITSFFVVEAIPEAGSVLQLGIATAAVGACWFIRVRRAAG